MKEHPIIFSGEMVRAILDGRKTQTRRVIKPQPTLAHPHSVGRFFNPERDAWDLYGANMTYCPYGVPGDHLWVRETWQKVYEKHDGFWTTDPRENVTYKRSFIEYAATAQEEAPRWRPSIHMPRQISRLTLEIVSVRVERLQEITDDDARAEGAPVSWREPATGWQVMATANGNAPAWFASLWDTINAKRGYGWDTNPWVWAIQFKRVQS